MGLLVEDDSAVHARERLENLGAFGLGGDWPVGSFDGADRAIRVDPDTINASPSALIRHLRRRKALRRSQRATTAGQPRGQIVDAVSIRERPSSWDAERPDSHAPRSQLLDVRSHANTRRRGADGHTNGTALIFHCSVIVVAPPRNRAERCVPVADGYRMWTVGGPGQSDPDACVT